MPSSEIEQFVAAFDRSVAAGRFIKLTISNYKGSDDAPQRISARIVKTKKGTFVQLQYKFPNRETVSNYKPAEAVRELRGMLASGYRSGHLFTSDRDLQLTIGKRSARLAASAPALAAAPPASNDRAKTTPIDPQAPYLKTLGITTDSGEVRQSQQAKWRQINKFVETLASLIDRSDLAEARSITIADMGSGKGYLTFAAYDYLANARSIDVKMTGVDTKSEIVQFCGELAAACDFSGLHFAHGTIADFAFENIDVLIALHACDTATDDAIFKGIAADASLIIAAPCCHKEVRLQIASPRAARDILKHGTLMERTAETLTDGIRALLLEREGYSTSVFEFVGVEHTPKNNMIAGIRRPARPNRAAKDEQIDFMMSTFSISRQRLRDLLASGLFNAERVREDAKGAEAELGDSRPQS